MLSVETLYGQGFQAGLQGGSSLVHAYDFYTTYKNQVVDKGAFLRYETKSGWAFELNASHYNYQRDNNPISWGCAPEVEPNIAGKGYEDLKVHNYFNAFSLNLSAERAIIKPNKVSNFYDYAGYSIGLKRVYQKESTDYQFSDESTINTRNGYSNSTTPYIGISNSLFYRLNKHIVIRNTVGVECIPNRLHCEIGNYNYSSNTHLRISLGIGYRLN